MIRVVRRFVRFWFDFVVGDDWRIAVGIAVVVALAGLAAHARAARPHVIAVCTALAVFAIAAGALLGEAARSSRRARADEG